MKTTPEAAPAAGDGLLGSLLEFARGWNRFWFQPANPTTLCLMRVCTGLVAVYVFVSYSVDLTGFVGDDAWLDRESMRFIRQRMEADLPADDWSDARAMASQNGAEFSRAQHHVKVHFIWSIWFHISDPRWIWTVHGLVIGVTVLFALGLWTRMTAPLVWAASLCYTHRAITNVFGMDTMLNILLLYLMIGPCGACLSLDRLIEKWRARRRGEPEPPVQPSASANFAIRMLQIHFCFIYLSSGFSKLAGNTWWSGTALEGTFLNYTFAPMDVPAFMAGLTWLARHRWLWSAFMTFGVVFTFWTEIGLPFLIWDRRWKWFMICCAVLLHTGIGLFMGLVMFSVLMIVLVFSFAPPEHVEGFLKGLATQGRRLWGRTTAQAKGPALAPARP
jgi:hypothetical protein